MLALQEEARLRALDDDTVLELAAARERILVTRNSRDFAPILVEWARGGWAHAGCILIWSLDHAWHEAIVAGVERLLVANPGADAWRSTARSL